MITNFTEQQTSPFEIIGQKLRIHHSEEQVVKQDDAGETISYNYITAVCSITDNRDAIIESIIRSKYTIGQEFALINNKDEKPTEYQDYQNFRQLSKNFADNWLS